MNQLASLYCASLQYACVNIILSLLYEHIFDLLQKLKDTRIIQGHLQIFSKFKDNYKFSQTSRTRNFFQGHFKDFKDVWQSCLRSSRYGNGSRMHVILNGNPFCARMHVIRAQKKKEVPTA